MKKAQKQEKSNLFLILLFFVTSIVCIVFSVLCIFQSHSAFLSKHALGFSIFTTLFFIAFCVLCIILLYRKKEMLVKTCLSIFFFLAFVLVLTFIFQITGVFEIIKDEAKLQAFLERAGVWMPILYILLQFLQVIVLPIPSIVSTAAGVALFGAFQTTLFSLIGILLGSFVAFWIGRKLGYRAVAWMVGAETLTNWQKKLKGKDNLFLSLMFLLPFFPDDILCFIAGLSSMSSGYFTALIFLSRFFAITATCYSIDFIPLNTWWGILLWVIFIAVVAVSFTLVYKNMDKIQKFLAKRCKAFRKRNKKQ